LYFTGERKLKKLSRRKRRKIDFFLKTYIFISIQ